MRTLLPIVLLATACKQGNPPTASGFSVRSVELSNEFESSGNRIALRFTNASGTSTDVRRALNALANERVDPVDLLMRGGLVYDEDGEVVEPEGSPEALLGSTAVDQARAFLDKILLGDGIPYAEDLAQDSCGNPMVFATVPAGVLQHLDQSPQGLPVWPASCPEGNDCETAEIGTFDIAIGEARFDGMTNVSINVYSDLSIDPIVPAFWGHFTGMFLTQNNANFEWAPMFANIGEARIQLDNVMQLTNTYSDGVGQREVYAFPHRERTLGPDEISVALDPYETTEDYWIRSDLGAFELPFGADVAPLGIDVTAPLGAQMVIDFNQNEDMTTELARAFEYQIAALMACPTVTEKDYIREGPVEIFLCPEGDLETCIAEEDVEEAACALQPDVAPNLPVVQTQPTEVVSVPPAQSPVLLSYNSLSVQETIEITIDVNPDSVLYLLGDDRIVSVSGGQAVPDPISNTHCGDTVATRYDVGANWPADTYTVSLDLTPDPDGMPNSGDELLVDGENNQLWVYYTGLETWRP